MAGCRGRELVSLTCDTDEEPQLIFNFYVVQRRCPRPTLRTCPAAGNARSSGLPVPGCTDAAISGFVRFHEIRACWVRRQFWPRRAGWPAIVPLGSIRIELRIDLSEGAVSRWPAPAGGPEMGRAPGSRDGSSSAHPLQTKKFMAIGRYRSFPKNRLWRVTVPSPPPNRSIGVRESQVCARNDPSARTRA